MTQEQIYDFIGKLAITLHAQRISISFTALNAILSDKNCSFESNRGLASAVAAAYRYWETKDDLAIAHSIALTFKNKDGEYAWSDE